MGLVDDVLEEIVAVLKVVEQKLVDQIEHLRSGGTTATETIVQPVEPAPDGPPPEAIPVSAVPPNEVVSGGGDLPNGTPIIGQPGTTPATTADTPLDAAGNPTR